MNLEEAMYGEQTNTSTEVSVPQNYSPREKQIGKLDSYMPLFLAAAIIIGYASTYIRIGQKKKHFDVAN